MGVGFEERDLVTETKFLFINQDFTKTFAPKIVKKVFKLALFPPHHGREDAKGVGLGFGTGRHRLHLGEHAQDDFVQTEFGNLGPVIGTFGMADPGIE